MKIEKNTQGRRFAISDIHGCLKTLKALLKKIDIQKEDALFFLGDYVDRGSDSKGVIDHIWQLKNDGYEVYALRGNHEEMMLQSEGATDGQNVWLQKVGLKTMASFPEGRIADEYFRWIEELPLYFETEDYLMVHAGINFANEDIFEDKEALVWIRDWYDDLDKNKLDGRIIIHGHTPTARPVLEERLTDLSAVPIVNIDCGCFYEKPGMGWLIAYNMDEQAYIFQENIEN